ncbi:MAG: acyloxyacyl hydrolase [Cytophagales bacterium]|nr:acyloxyacyl hydrolase [Cytophagales bacterium]
MDKCLAAGLAWLATVGLLAPLQAQDTTAVSPRVFSVGLSGQYGFIFAHTQDVENTRGARPWGVQATFVWQRTDAQSWNTCACYPRQGLLLGYYNYDSPVLGHSAKAAYFLEPAFRITSRLSGLVRGIGGAAYLTDPYHPVRNPLNQSYSLPVSIYIAFGLGLNYQLTPRYRLNAQAVYEHISNGGMKEPNKGINYPMMSLGLEYALNPVAIPERSRAAGRAAGPFPWQWEAYGFASSRTPGFGQKRRYFIGGAGVLVRKRVGRIHAFNAGLEGYADFASRERMRQDSVNGRSHLRIGLLAGHDFVLGRFLFSQQLGVYVFNQIPYFSRVYHRWGLTYALDDRWAVGFNLKAHRHVANFIELRAVRKLGQR